MRLKQRKITFVILVLLLVGLVVMIGFLLKPRRFNGNRAYLNVVSQVNLGPRTPGTEAHAKAIQYIVNKLNKAGWETMIQQGIWNNHQIKNIVAYRGNDENAPEILLGAHYDTRSQADRDPVPQPGLAVPGANDGASGVAVLLELARTLPRKTVPIWLVFFDAEDNGNIQGWDWIIGSTIFMDDLSSIPKAVVIVDMVGDKDLNLFIEKNSDPALVNEIWAQAQFLGYNQFIPMPGYSLLDDHFPFLEEGIPAVDIIDFDYPYYHTSADTPDKVSPESLEAVGRTLYEWVMSR